MAARRCGVGCDVDGVAMAALRLLRSASPPARGSVLRIEFKRASPRTDEGLVTGSRDRWVVRASVAGLLVVLCFLAGFSVMTQQRVARESKQADTAMRLSATYQDARYWVTEAKSIERAYHFEGSSTVRFAYERATQDLDADLLRVIHLDPSPQNRKTISHLLALSGQYDAAAKNLF